MNYKKFFIITLPLATLFSCTKLEEKFNGELGEDDFGGSGGSANVDALVNGVYNAMRLPYQDQSRWWAAQEHRNVLKK